MKKELIEKILDKFNDDIAVVTITSIYNKINLLLSKFTLDRNGPVGNIVLLDGPLVEPTTKPDITNKHPKDGQEQLDKFIKKMEENFSEETLTRMYNNLKKLKINEKNIYLIFLSAINGGLVGGAYFPETNQVVTYSQKGLDISKRLYEIFKHKDSRFQLEQIYSHELLHMASTSKNNGKICAGFHHFYAPGNNIPKILRNLLTYSGRLTDFSIGMGINEGYTELLNTRIFNREGAGGIYSIYRETARLIENVIGKDKMTELYFKNDLKGLVKELSNYISEKETKRLIVILDQSMGNKKLLSKIPEYFIKLYDNKIKKELQENKITIDQAKDKYIELKNMIVNLVNTINGNMKKMNININVDEIISKNNQPQEKRRGTITSTTILTINIITILMLLIALYLNTK